MPAEYTAQGRIKRAKPDGAGGFVSDIGGGAISGINISALDGGIAHGNRIRIEAESSYAIGAKAQAAPRAWVMGSEILIDGQAVSAETIGGAPNTTEVWREVNVPGASGLVSNDTPRHSNADRFYRFIGRAELKDILAIDALSKEETKRHTFLARYRAGQHYQSTRFFTYENLSGTFSFPSNRARGEVCNLTSADTLETREVYVSYVDPINSTVTLESKGFNFYSTGSTQFKGGTLVGQQSGASLDIAAASDISVASSVKLFRLDQAGDRTNGVYLTFSCASGGQIFNAANISGVDQNDPYIYVNRGAPDDFPGEWVLQGALADYSGAASRVALFSKDGFSYTETTYNSSAFDASPSKFNASLVGLDTNGLGSFSYSSAGITLDMGEVYVDNDSRVLWLCNAPTFAGSTEFELLRPEAWTENPDGSVVIDAHLYQGAFSDFTAKYVALTDGPDIVFEGVAI